MFLKLNSFLEFRDIRRFFMCREIVRGVLCRADCYRLKTKIVFQLC